MNAQRAFIVVLLAVALVGTSLAQEVPYGKERWRADFTDDVRWIELTDVGYLIVGTDEALCGINPSDGSIAWTLSDLRKVPDGYVEIIPFSPFAMVTRAMGAFGAHRETALIDVVEGKLMWSSKDIGLTAAYGQFLLAPMGGILVYGKAGKPAKSTLVLADLLTGQAKWMNDSLFAMPRTPAMYAIDPGGKDSRSSLRGNQYPVWLKDGTFLELWSKNGLRKINAATGEVVWTAPIKFTTVPGIEAGFPPMLLRDDGASVFVPCGKTVHLVNTADGRLLWEMPFKFSDKIDQMTEIPQGLLVKGGSTKPFIALLNPQNGDTVWQRKFRARQYATPFCLRDNKIIYSADGSLFALNVSDGAATELAANIEFEGMEVPYKIELSDSGCVLLSDQNMVLLDRNGKSVYHAYHKAPGPSLLTQIAKTVAAGAASAGQQYVAYGTAQSEGRPLSTSEEIQLQQSQERLMANASWTQRFVASAQARDFVYVLTNVEGGSAGSAKNAGIVKVEKTTGRDVCRVALGTKKPEYEVDEIDGRLYFVDDGHQIVCYDF